MSDIRLGRQTPTVSRVLPYTDSRGTEAVEQYNQSGRTAQEWQERMVEDIMATNEQGLWVHMKFGWAVPRRNGKSEILIMRAIWGLVNGERVLYTAHRATTSSSAWEKVCKLLGKMGFAEEEDYKPYRTRGLEQILWLHGEGVINFRTRTSTGGLGEGYDLLIIDEAQEYTGDQESALKYVVTDSKNRAAVYSGAYIGMLAEETLLASGTGDYAVTVFREGQQGQYSNFAGLLNLNSKTLSVIRYLTAADKYDKMHEVTAETARGSSMTVNPELHYLNHTLQSPYLKTAYSFKNGTLSATTGQDVNAVFTIPMENYFNIVQEYNQSEYDGYFDLKIPYDIQVTDMNGTGNQTAFYKTYTVRKHAMKSSGQKTILTDQVEHTVGASSAGAAGTKLTLSESSTQDKTKPAFYAILNTDEDTSYLSYTGRHWFKYTNPSVLAVLSSPPYFKDLLENDTLSGNYPESTTSYGTTKGTGSGSSSASTISAGSYIAFEQSFELLGVEIASIEAELAMSSSITEEFSESSEVSYTTEFATSSGADAVVFYSVPYEYYEYDMHYVKNGKAYDTVQTICIPKQPCTATVEMEKYRMIAENYKELPQLDENVLNHTLGAPETYPDSTSRYKNVREFDGNYMAVDFTSAGGGIVQAQSIEMSEEKENAYTEGEEFEFQTGAGTAGLTFGISKGFASELSAVKTSSAGCSFTAEMQNMPKEAEEYGYGMSWKLFSHEGSYINSDGETVRFPVVDDTLPGTYYAKLEATGSKTAYYDITLYSAPFTVNARKYDVSLKAEPCEDSKAGVISMTLPETKTISEETLQYESGTLLKLTAVPQNGYQFERWEINGQVNRSAAISVQLLPQNTEIRLYFKQSLGTVTVDESFTDGGTVEKPDDFVSGAEYAVGTAFTFTAKDDGERVFDRWVKVVGSYSFDETDHSITVTVSETPVILYPVFKGAPYTVALGDEFTAKYEYVNAQEETVSANLVSGGVVSAGTEVTVALKDGITLSDGDRILLNGEEITLTNGAYTFTVSKNTEIYIDNPNKTYTIAVVPHDTKGNTVPAQFDLLAEYENGASVTLIAPAVTGYNFVGWFNGTEKLSSKNQYTFVIRANADLAAVYEAVGKVSLTISCEGIFTVNDDTKSSTYKMDYPLGSKVTVATNNSDFAYWTNSYGMILSRSASYTFTVNGEETITAVMNTPIADKVTVVFESAYNQVMARNQISEGGTMELPSVPYYNGYIGLGWDLNGDGRYDANDTLAAAIARGFAAENKVVTVKPVYQLKDTTYTVAVVGGTGSGIYNQNERITVTADAAPEGKKFSHWENAAQNILSYNDSFQIVVDSDMTLTAVFVDADETVEEQGTAAIISMTKDEENHKLSFVSYCTIPENCRINKAGVIATNNALVGASGNPDDFNAETAVYVFGDESDADTYRFTFTKSKVNSGDTWYVRAYLVYTDDAGNSHTVYGEIVSQTM